MDKKTALIADDSEMNSALLEEMISPFGFEAEIAENGAEALELARKNSYDIVFMDHLMPVMDGIEALNAIRSENLLGGVPIIMVTANDDISDREKYFSVGFTDYMKKPFSVKKIGDLLLKYGLIEGTVCEKDEWGELSDKLKFLEIDRIVDYFMNDPSFYIQVLHEYMKSDILVRLKQADDAEEKDDLRAHIRCIKEEAYLIGAKSLAAKARDAEKKLLEGDFESFRESLKKLLGAQKSLIKRLMVVLS